MSEWVDGRVHEVIRWSDKLFSLRIEAGLEPYQAGQFTKLSLMLPAADGSGALERVSHAYPCHQCAWRPLPRVLHSADPRGTAYSASGASAAGRYPSAGSPRFWAF